MEAASPLVAARGIVKRFGTLVALSGVDFMLRRGEVHALVGENGAGKSTLMSVLYGLYPPDDGVVERQSEATIGMVFQHYQLIERFTVAENVMLGREIVRGGVLDRAAMSAAVHGTAARYGFEIDPDVPVERLGVGARQRVELLKALERDASVVILDEPTAALSPAETDALFEVIRRFKREGRAVAFVSHKLREVLDIADRVTILRRGHVVGTTAARDADVSALAEAMVGRQVKSGARSARTTTIGAPLLVIEALTAHRDDGAIGIRDLDLNVRSGEILGVAGVEGNGQLELSECVYGLRRTSSGRLMVDGTDITHAPTRMRRALGIRYVPGDSAGEGLVGSFAAPENVLLGDQRAGKRITLDVGGARTHADALAKEYALSGYAPDAPVGTFSGGTQQKLVIGRELTADARLVIAYLPTRGVDVGAAEIIHRRLREVRDRGAAIVLISYDLDEIRALSDRIVVMASGRVAGEIGPGASDREIGRLMGGVAAGA